MTPSIKIAHLPHPTNSRTFPDGSVRSWVKLHSTEIGYGLYQPSWRWSHHARSQTGQISQNHIGYIISGRMVILDAEGVESMVGPGDAFEVGPDHDAWVIGDEPCCAIDYSPLKKESG